jgi:hypothetical protein
MAPEPEHRTLGDELVRAADRDIEQLGYIENLYARVVALLERVGTLEHELADERLARERLELRVYARELRDDGLPLIHSTRVADLPADADPAEPGNVVPLIREYAADTEPIPTTDQPTGDDDDDHGEGGDTDA